MSEDAFVVFDPILFDENEQPLSCPDTLFACLDHDAPLPPNLLALIAEDSDEIDFERWGFNLGINNKFDNSRGAPSICNGSTSKGHVQMRLDNPGEVVAVILIGFIGLNNSDDTGTFESFWFYPTGVAEGFDEKGTAQPPLDPSQQVAP